MLQHRPLKQVKRIHFIGIGGAGMGGIAEVLLHQGYTVSGSDISNNAMVQRLEQLGAIITLGHSAENIEGVDIVVYSTAISPTNPEYAAAKENRIPVIQRAQMLADLMRPKYGIAVAGTHGKTTTTSLLASVLIEADLDPTFVIGGLLKSANTHSYLGKSNLFLAEADESDASFLYLYPEMAIVTNIDADHMETYQNDFTQLQNTFIQFLHRLPFNGLAVACLDDPVVANVIMQVDRPVLTYGFHSGADLQITNFEPSGFQSRFTLKHPIGEAFEVCLNLPGRHNVLNATAVCGIALGLGVKPAIIQSALAKFEGVGRRMQVHGELQLPQGHALWVDDYGHHPREMTATWEAVRQAWPGRRLVVVFQPHRYSRMRDLFNDFVTTLSNQVDQLVLLDVYSAGETEILSVNGQALFEAVRLKSKIAPVFVPEINTLLETLMPLLKDNDVLLTQGAGSVGSVGAQLNQFLR